jgi:hypothetical protein
MPVLATTKQQNHVVTKDHTTRPYFSPYLRVKWGGKIPLGITAGLYKQARSSTWRAVANNLAKGLIPSKESYIKPWLDTYWQQRCSPQSATHSVMGHTISNKQIAQGMSGLSLALLVIGLKRAQGKNLSRVTIAYVARLVKKKIVSLLYKKIVLLADDCAHKKGYTQGCLWYPNSIIHDQMLYPVVKKAWHLVAKTAILVLLNQFIAV